MKKNIFAICDLEPDYASRFMDYLSQRNNIPFEVRVFTSTQALLSFAKENHIELLLISEKAMTRELKEIEVGRVVILSEGNTTGEQEYACVYKYQSSAQVLRETMAAYSEAPQVSPGIFPVLKKSTAVYGIYSPLGRCKKTSLALALGQELARRCPTLYLNFEGCSGLGKLLGKSFSHTLSDLLYYTRLRDGTLLHRMNGLVQTVNKLDYIPPVSIPGDLHQAAWKDWEFLMQELIAHSGYEALVLDIGNEVEDPLVFMQLCDAVLMPVLGDTISLCKLSQFEEMLDALEEQALKEKIRRILLPAGDKILPAEHFVEELLWGVEGDCARAFLAERSTEKNNT